MARERTIRTAIIPQAALLNIKIRLEIIGWVELVEFPGISPTRKSWEIPIGLSVINVGPNGIAESGRPLLLLFPIVVYLVCTVVVFPESKLESIDYRDERFCPFSNSYDWRQLIVYNRYYMHPVRPFFLYTGAACVEPQTGR